ncbi:MAG TPA: transcriptional regulator [Fervidobacterium sp.]|nr:transcriptional regulator [Fervidobacterium sp.]
MAKKKTVVNIGIMSLEKFRARTIAIAKGEYVPKPNEPKIWFESIQSLAQVLGEDNQELLRVIVEKAPTSMKELAELTGRKSSNVCRTLKTMERAGVVELKKENKVVRPIAKVTNFRLEFGIGASV